MYIPVPSHLIIKAGPPPCPPSSKRLTKGGRRGVTYNNNIYRLIMVPPCQPPVFLERKEKKKKKRDFVERWRAGKGWYYIHTYIGWAGTLAGLGSEGWMYMYICRNVYTYIHACMYVCNSTCVTYM